MPLHDIRIEVHSTTTGATLETCFTDATGTFQAYHLPAGTYELIATHGVDETTARVMVDSGTVQAKLQLPEASVSPKQGTISIAELRVPDKVKQLVGKARTALTKGLMGEAEKFVQSALAIAPNYADALTMHAVLRLHANDKQTALNDLDSAVKADPTYAPAYLVLGSTFNQMGRYDEALRSLDRSSMYDPRSWECAFEMAKSYLGKRDYARTLMQLDRAQSLGGAQASTPSHIVRGYALMGERHFDQAASEFEAYLAAEPKSDLAPRLRMTIAQLKTSMVQNAAVPLTPNPDSIFNTPQH